MWETFVLKGNGTVPTMTIRKNLRTIGVNKKAVDMFKLAQYKFVIFMIDQEARKIGLQFINKEKKGVCKVQAYNTGLNIPAYNFLKHYKIEPKRGMVCEFDEKEKMLIAKY